MATAIDPNKQGRQLAASLTPHDLTAFFNYHHKGEWWVRRVKYPIENPIVWVVRSTLGQDGTGPMMGDDAEMGTQGYVCEELSIMIPRDLRHGIRVPEVYRILRDNEHSYLITELVPGTIFRHVDWPESGIPGIYLDKIARALRLLLSLPAPEGTRPGPLPEGYITNELFYNGRAAKLYDSVQELEDDINDTLDTHNKEYRQLTGRIRHHHPYVKLEQQLCLIYPHLDEDAFMITDDGDLCLLSLHLASYLPLTFLPFTVGCYPENDDENYTWISREIREGVEARLKGIMPQQNMGAMEFLRDEVGTDPWFDRD